MIKIYGTSTCSDCAFVKEQIKDNNNFELIDIAQNVKLLKAFLKLRDNNPIFDTIKKEGKVGIPCFVLEDGTITLSAEEVGLKSLRTTNQHDFCNIDGSGC